MATQPPSGNRGVRRSPGTSGESGKSGTSGKPGTWRQPPPRENTTVRDPGPDTVWHTRGRHHGHTRLRAPLPRSARSPQRQLPPSRVPRLLLWGLLLVLLAVLASAVARMTQ
ncbi:MULTISPECIES: hypothetical protein [Cupriavidus]